MSDIVEAVRQWSRYGWRMFPVHPVTKRPLVKTGRDHAELASSNPEQADHWPEVDGAPASIGVTTGAANGVVVIDCDAKHDGEALLRELEELLGPLPRDWTVRTQSGGGHIYLAHPGEGRRVKSNAGVLGCLVREDKAFAAGVDVRGDGGLAVFPPSAGYTWESRVGPRPPPIPDGWLPHLLAPPRPVREATGDGDVIPEGGRNDELFRLGAAMRGMGAGHEEIQAALRVANETRCDPPLDDDEVQRVAASAADRAPLPGGGMADLAAEFLKMDGEAPAQRSAVRAADVVDEIYREAALPRISTPFPELERRVGGFRAGTLTTLIAPPGYGKTSFALQLASHRAESGPVIFWTGELTVAQLVGRVASQRLDVGWGTVLDGLVDRDRVRGVLDSLDLHLVHGGDPVASIAAALAELPTDPMPVWFVDYVQIGSAATSEIRQNVMRQMRGLRDIARRGTVGFALAQPNRPGARSLRTGKGDSASAVDLGGESGSIEHDSANVLALSIEMVEGRSVHDGRLVVAKARFGGPSTMGIRFHGAAGRFEELDAVPDTEADREHKDEILKQVRRHDSKECTCAGRKLSRNKLVGAETKSKPHGTGIRKETLLSLVRQMVRAGELRDDPDVGLTTRQEVRP